MFFAIQAALLGRLFYLADIKKASLLEVDTRKKAHG
jgi:hypothetical protein